jgi:2-polyprenyl-3-methyl-5-hydroxy-6-metoxy-1,4-benzoquinol methylase
MTAVDYTILTDCVACGESELTTTLDLGSQPLANDFLEPGSEFDTYPLKLVRCSNCFHSQLSIAVNPARLFRDYSYVSGTSETLSVYFDNLAKMILHRFGSKKKILDIGSNDGSFLEKFGASDWISLGVDPAVNLIPESASRGVTTVPTFFDQNIASLLSHDFDVIVAMNVFAHTQHPLGILNGIARCLATNGRAFIQTSQANMFSSGQFDTVYHEHISFFNVRSMKALLARAELSLVEVTIVPIHGMSYLWEVQKGRQHAAELPREAEEEDFGLYELNLYSEFASLARNCSAHVVRTIKEFRDRNFKIVSYGAAAKGNTFINFAEISFDYIFDDTPQKIGRMSPAGNCIVSDPAKLDEIESPLLIIIPAWNFAAEILEKIRLLRTNNDDMYLTYFPEIELKNVF